MYKISSEMIARRRQQVKSERAKNSPAMKALTQAAIADYEALVWRMVENGDSTVPSDGGAILHVAGRTLEDLAIDLQAVQKRIALQGDVTGHGEVVKEQARVAEKRLVVEQEYALVKQDFDARLSVIDTEASELSQRERTTRKAVEYFRDSAPEWLRDLYARVKRHQDHVKAERQSLHPPKATSSADEDRAARSLARDPEASRAFQETRERRDAQYYEDKSAYAEGIRQADAREAELAKERVNIEAAMLLLQPTPGDLVVKETLTDG